MSRVGKKPVELVNGVSAELKDSVLKVKGPKGELSTEIHPKVTVQVMDNEIQVDVAKKEDRKEKALWGLFRSLINNMVVGVTQGYSRELDVAGVGFKVDQQGQKLVLSLGYSHTIDYNLPESVTAEVEKKKDRVGIEQYQTTITLNSIDKQLLGQVSAEIRKLRKPEPYKGKGIRFSDEVVRRKAGKSAKSGE